MNWTRTLAELGVDCLNQTYDVANAIDGVPRDIVTIRLDRDEWIDIAQTVGKKSAIGAAVDGTFGLYKAAIFYRNGHINKKTMALHVFNEIGCGAISSAVGQASSIAIRVAIDSNPTAFLVGLAGSAGTRWVYRRYMPDILPDLDSDGENNEEEDLEDIVVSVIDDVIDKE